MSIRATAVVRRVLEAAREPIAYDALASLVLAQTESATEEKVERLLAELCEQTLLLTDLRPPLTVASPVRYVIQRLEAIPAANDVRRALEEIVAAAARWDAAPSSASRCRRRNRSRHRS